MWLLDKRQSKRFWSHRLGVFGLIIIGIFSLIAGLGPYLIGDAGLAIDLSSDLAWPTKAMPFGKAENGIDVLTWLIHGTRVSMFIAFIVSSFSCVLGVTYGAFSAYFGGKVDALMMRVVDILLAFPGMLLALYIAAILQPSFMNLVFALCATGWVGFARLARAKVLEIKERDFVLAAHALGVGPIGIFRKHLLPNLLGPVLVQASFSISTIILAEAALSFLGLGVPPGTPSWGALMDQGVAYLFVAPHISIFPGVCIMLTVLGFNFLGDGLRDAIDAKDVNG